MSNSMQVPVTRAKDITAKPLVARFHSASGGDGKATAARYATDVVLCAGQPSYALIGSPMADFGPGAWTMQSPGVAMIETGPAGKIKLIARASVGYMEGTRYQCLMNGWVPYQTHFLGEDSLITAVFDDRWVLEKFTCFGRMTWNPITKRHFFNTNNNDPMVFNQYGWGNCLDSRYGPRFSEGHRFGHTSSINADPNDEPEPGYATSASRKFTCSDIIDYLRDMFYNIFKRPVLMQDFGLMVLPQSIRWPKSLGAALSENRTPRDFSLEGISLLAALQRVVRYAGPYDIYLRPINDFQSQLEIINYAPKRGSGVIVYGQGYGIDSIEDALSNPQYAVDGWIKENATGYFNDVAYMGDSPAIEVMASTDASDGDAFGGLLENAWEDATEELFKTTIGVDGDAEAFNKATKHYPDVFNYYKISLKKNPFEGTKWAGLFNGGGLRVKTHQLSSYNQSASSPLGIVPMDVIVEFKMSDFEYDGPQAADPPEPSIEKTSGLGPWKFATRYTDLQLSPCGRYIQIPAVRDAVNTWYINYDEDPGAGGYDGSKMYPREIRIQLVIEAEQCLVARAGTDTTDPYGTLSRIDPSAPKFTYQVRNQPMQYVDWLRRGDSFPYGRGGLTAGEIIAVQAKASRGNELFTDHIGDGDLTNPKNRLARHADITLSNVKRVAYEGIFNIAMISPIYHPGMAVRYENGGGMPAFGVVKCVHFSREQQGQNGTEVEWGPNEWSAIWDGPLRMSGSFGGGGASKKETPPIESSNEMPKPSGGGGETPSGGGGETPSGGGGNSSGSDGGSSGGNGNTSESSGGVDMEYDQETDDGTGTGKTVRGVRYTETPGPAELKQTINQEEKTEGAAAAQSADRGSAKKAEKAASIAAGKAVQRSNQGSVDTREMNAANKSTDTSIARRSLGSAAKGDGGPLKGAAYDQQRRTERGMTGKDITQDPAFKKRVAAAKASKPGAAAKPGDIARRVAGPSKITSGRDLELADSDAAQNGRPAAGIYAGNSLAARDDERTAGARGYSGLGQGQENSGFGGNGITSGTNGASLMGALARKTKALDDGRDYSKYAGPSASRPRPSPSSSSSSAKPRKPPSEASMANDE